MTTNAYPETNVQVIEKALYCLKHGETESVENWLDLLRERLTENSRADALTDDRIEDAIYRHIAPKVALENAKALYAMAAELLAAFPASQPAAAPIDEPKCTCGMPMGHTRTCAAFVESMMRADLLAPSSACKRCGSTTAQACNDIGCFYLESGDGEPAPAPADERAAMEAAWNKKTGERWFGGAGLTRTLWEAAWQAAIGWTEARAASANETAAEGTEAVAWVWCDTIHSEHCHSTDAEAIEEGWIPLVYGDPKAVQVADEKRSKIEAAIKATEYKYFGSYEFTESQHDAVDVLVEAARTLLAAPRIAPQPAQADARVGLDDATQRPLYIAAFNDRHEFDIFPSDELRSGAFNEFVAGWYAALTQGGKR